MQPRGTASHVVPLAVLRRVRRMARIQGCDGLLVPLAQTLGLLHQATQLPLKRGQKGPPLPSVGVHGGRDGACVDVVGQQGIELAALAMGRRHRVGGGGGWASADVTDGSVATVGRVDVLGAADLLDVPNVGVNHHRQPSLRVIDDDGVQARVIGQPAAIHIERSAGRTARWMHRRLGVRDRREEIVKEHGRPIVPVIQPEAVQPHPGGCLGAGTDFG